MSEIIDYFSEPGSFLSFVLALMVIVAFIKVAEKVWSWCSLKLTSYYNIRRKKETQTEQVTNQDKRITEIDEKLDAVMSKIDEIVDTFNKFEERQKSVNTILLRDKIKYIYKKCLTDGYILDKDKQDFKYAYDEYVANGGNSYVIDEVEPFIHGIKVFLSDEDAKEAGY